MNKSIEQEFDGIISKNFLKKEIKSYVMLHKHGLQDRITAKVIEKCMCFVSGYIKCFRHFGSQPINPEEVQSLLVQECIDWVIEYLESGEN